MNRDIIKRSLLTLLALVITAALLAGCSADQPAAPSDEVTEAPSSEPATEPTSAPDEAAAPEERPATMKLLGFESYEDFTGSKILIGNMLGRMEINTDPEYITEGEGSIMFRPQGDYSRSSKHPFFKIDFLNTTATTCNFSEFRSVSFDAYNATDRELHIRVCLSVGKDDGNYATSIKSVYTLAPNAWTTCTYDVSEMAGFVFYDLENMRYMTFEFLEHKTSKDDVPATIYLDNLVGNYYAEGETPAAVDFDFRQGIEFENSFEQFLLFSNDYNWNKTEISRAHYTEEGISLIPSVGAYGMKIDATGSIWPTFSIKLGETAPKDMVLSFKAYVKVRGAENDIFLMESYDESTGGRIANIVELSDNVCNEWFDVSIRLGRATDTVTAFFNFDDFSMSYVTNSRFSGKDVYIYIDNLKLSEWVDPASITPSNPDFGSGIGFERDGEQYLFENSNTGLSTSIRLARVSYSDEGVSAPDNGGRHALRGVVRGAAFPEIKVDYRKTIPAGSVLTFMAYVRPVSGGSAEYKVESFGNACLTDKVPTGQWVPIKVRLTGSQSSSRFFFNFDSGSGKSKFGTGKVLVYMDMFTIEVPVPASGDILEGYGFEEPGNASYWTGQGRKGYEIQDAEVKRMTYAQAGLTAPENCGEYVLKISHESFIYPKFRISFGKTLPVGTEITFKAYGTVNGPYSSSTNLFQFTSASGGGGNEASKQFPLGEWTDISIVLEKSGDYVDLFWDYSRSGCADPTPGAVYIDNVKAVLPIVPEGDFLEGVGFEIPENAALITGQKREGMSSHDGTIARVKYADAGISAPSGGGSYALRISHESFIYPKFRINFGRYLPEGTVFTFMAYGTVDGQYSQNQNLFQFTSESGGGGNEATPIFGLNEWTKVSFTLEKGGSYVDLFWDYSRCGCADPTPGAVYIDKVQAKLPPDPVIPEPVELDITKGVDFEVPEHSGYVTAAGTAASAIVEYADEGLTVDAGKYGSNAMKLSGPNAWPEFRIDFGKELEAGTRIIFDAYGVITAVAEGKEKATYEALVFEFRNGTATGSETVQFADGSWMTLEFTLAKNASYIEGFFNLDRANGTAGYVYIDNMRVKFPPEPVTLDITRGTGFEQEGEAAYITKRTYTEDAEYGSKGDTIPGTVDSISWVSYEEESITAPEDGGSHAVGLVAGNKDYPSFRINFGKTLPEGTIISFDANVTFVGSDRGVQFELSRENSSGGSNGNVGPYLYQNTWTRVSFATRTESDHVDLYFSSGEGNQKAVAFIDNLSSAEPVIPDPVELDLTQGTSFEEEDEIGYITQRTHTETGELIYGTVDAIERVSYEDEGLADTANRGSGDYLIRLMKTNFGWPNFRINFGKTLPAGTDVAFKAYGIVTGAEGPSIFAYSRDNEAGGNQGEIGTHFGQETWTDIRFKTLVEDDHVDLYFDAREEATRAVIYIDDLAAGDAVFTLDITQGVDFETPAHSAYVSGSGSSSAAIVDYETEGLAVEAEKYGVSAMKLSGTDAWPNFRLDFGKELAAGTRISFDAYGAVTALAEGKEPVTYDALVFEFRDGAVKGNETVQFGSETWTALGITLAKDVSYIEGFFNLDRANGAEGYVYIDNILAAEPYDMDITRGVTFEDEKEVAYFTPSGKAVVAVTGYEAEGLAADTEKYGANALRLSGDDAWPAFTLNFGKELVKGTTISFDAYGVISSLADGVDTAVHDALVFEFRDGAVTGNETLQFDHETWTTLTVTLAKDASSIDGFFNLDRAGGATGYVYIDNITVKEPEPYVFTMDITGGADFEHEEHKAYITERTDVTDAGVDTMAIVKYADEGISAPENGEEHCFKIQNDNSPFAHFRICFGKELSADTVISFKIYAVKSGRSTSAALYAAVPGSGTGNNGQIAVFAPGAWTDVSFKLGDLSGYSEDAKYVDLYYDNGYNQRKSGCIYIDDLAASK